uniref:Peptidase S1 domain-containing protein n=1 Tax=Panagrolaimus davidi TaxID=227884 RepID=A0A914QP39_9BILA
MSFMSKIIGIATILAALFAPAFSVNGGQPATVQEYPFLAQLTIHKPNGHTGRCSGSIVAQQFIISAYHCIVEPDFNDTYAIENTLVITRTNDAYNGSSTDGIVHKVERFYHKEIDGYYEFSAEKDLLIIKLTEPIEYNEVQKPIVLDGKENLKLNDSAIFAGIGPLPDQMADIFREGETNVIALDQIVYQYNESIVQSGGGDSGGPFFSKVNDDWILHGIIHGGNIIPRISYFCDWIKEVTENELNC